MSKGLTMGDTFEAPGPGQWSLDRSHFAGGTTPVGQWLMETAMERGMQRVFAEIGTPVHTLRARFVNGFMYTRLLPLIGPDRQPRKLPPLPVLRLVAHWHPAFRSRARAARATLRDRPWLGVVDRWERELKPALVAQNRTFQDVDPATLDDAALAGHLRALLDHAVAQAELHFWLHGHDLGPIALYLQSCIAWGIDPVDAVRALAGASPSTSAPAAHLVALRRLIEAAGIEPRTLDDVRAASPEAARLLDEHLAEHGHHLVTGYDLDALTLRELPGTVLTSILDARPPSVADPTAVIAELRERVPLGERARFDQELGDARAVMNLRDDNGPTTYEWPTGLLRRAMLEAGRRLLRAGRLVETEHVFELAPDELVALVRGTGGPSAAELARRAARRARLRELDPPATLGPAEPTPPPEVLPEPLPQLVRMVLVALEQLDMSGHAGRDPLVGAGVGSATYRGRVRRAANADEAMDRMEPGDVLVVRATSPAFNTVLSIAGAVVTANGGPLSHAAVLARELGIPAVVGAPGALDLPDGVEVEVDPLRGRVTVV